MVASLLPPDAEGGTERVAATQARGLRALGHDVLLLGGRPAGAAETLRLDHITTHYFASHRQLNPRGFVPDGPDMDALLRQPV